MAMDGINKPGTRWSHGGTLSNRIGTTPYYLDSSDTPATIDPRKWDELRAFRSTSWNAPT
jgi:hypothetical protein